jgi:hypothetical protein
MLHGYEGIVVCRGAGSPHCETVWCCPSSGPNGMLLELPRSSLLTLEATQHC